MTGSESAILAEGLTKYYGKVTGVKDLDLEVRRGEVFGFLGPNGAGKTTTIRLLMGLMRPSSGRASVMGRDAWRDSVWIKTQVGYLPGDARLYRGRTGEEHIGLVASFDGGGVEEAHRLAEKLDLELERKVSGYSRGMNQKLAIVLALMKRPPLIIMDEPTNALDPLMQRELFEVLNERREGGATILFSSHNLPEVERIAERVGIIRNGSLVATERMEDLRGMRLRNVEVIFADRMPPTGALESIPGVTDVEHVGNRVQMKLRGDINALIKLIAVYDVADFSVTHASLEDVFIEYYERDRRGPGSGAGGAA